MKVSELFEAGEIFFSKNKVYASVAQWFKDNNISKETAHAANERIKKSPEYRELVGLHKCEMVSGKTQLDRSTFAFKVPTWQFTVTDKIKDHTLVYTAWPTGQIRVQQPVKRGPGSGGNGSGGQSRLNTRDPVQISDKVSAEEAIVQNVVYGLGRILEILQKRQKQKTSVNDRLDATQWVSPEGVDVKFFGNSAFIIRKNKQGRFENIKDNHLSFTFTTKKEFPANYIDWKVHPTSIDIYANGMDISLANLPTPKNSISFHDMKKLDVNDLIKNFGKLDGVEIRFYGEHIKDLQVNLVKLLKYGITVSINEKGMTFVNQKMKVLLSDDSMTTTDKMLTFQQWLIDNNLERFAK